MKKGMILIVVALVLFAASALLSNYLQQGKKSATEAAGSHEMRDADTGNGSPTSHGSNTMLSQVSDADTQRVAVRPSYNTGAEEVVQLANSYRERLATVRERETQLMARQKQMELVHQDIRGERAAVDELRKQVAEELNAVKELQAQLKKKEGEVDEQQQKTAAEIKEMEQRGTKLEMVETSNVQKMAEMINNMPAESAARILQQMADSGKMDTAVKLMGQMKERQAAKILAEFSDPSLAAQLLEKLKDLKRPAAEPKK
jgi:flagellar motility protein MotE (MotC chaperone)